MKKLSLVLSLILVTLLFSGCVTVLSSETTVKLDAAENWQVNQELLFEGESFKEYGQTVVDGLNTLVANGQVNGLEITFDQLPERGGNVPYAIQISGRGLDKLNEILGSSADGTPAFTRKTQNGKTVFEFQMDASSLSSGGLDIGYSPELVFTIEGLKVVETNGKRSGNSVTWKNPAETMTATLTPDSGKAGAFAWWIIPVAVVGLAAIALVILLVTGVFKKKQPQQSQYYYPPGYGATTPPPTPFTSAGGPPPMTPVTPSAPPPLPAQPSQPLPPTVPPPPPASPNAMETVIAPRTKKPKGG